MCKTNTEIVALEVKKVKTKRTRRTSLKTIRPKISTSSLTNGHPKMVTGSINKTAPESPRRINGLMIGYPTAITLIHLVILVTNSTKVNLEKISNMTHQNQLL